ncbi:MAG TPA: prepilin-type N-terminal cleavage/methylation domain-containing protein [Bacillota bacterium]|nr:prepilin-type N-terminal cleavage/methylation domain-containing protein [Bacillota bacterium]
MKYKSDEAGLSLVELLAALTIASIIGVIAYSILFGGFKTYDRVKIEAELRDEADIIMAELISDLFTVKSSKIVERYFPENGTDNYYLTLTDGEIVGFYNNKIYVTTGPLNVLQNKSIKLGPDSKITEVAHGQFHIYLSLIHSESGQQLMTESEIAIIHDDAN